MVIIRNENYNFVSLYGTKLRYFTLDSMDSRKFFTRMTKESGIKSSQSPISQEKINNFVLEVF